jgi:hypothetical protein
VKVDDTKKTGKAMLKLDPLLEGADVVTHVETACRLDAGEDEILHSAGCARIVSKK